jgi:UDPglucose 6-dehydrogenase
MRDSPSLSLIDELLNSGARVTAHDPVAMDEAKHRFDGKQGVTFAATSYDALSNADALVVVTDWNEYRHPDFTRIKQSLRRPIIVDGRNLYALHRMSAMGFVYHSIGRPAVA